MYFGIYLLVLKVIVLDSLLQWAGVIDELEFAKRLSQWCKGGFSELGDKKGVKFSDTIDQVSVYQLPIFTFNQYLFLWILNNFSDEQLIFGSTNLINASFLLLRNVHLEKTSRICQYVCRPT